MKRKTPPLKQALMKRGAGCRCKDRSNSNPFRHAVGLPTVLSRAGYKYYVFMQSQVHEMAQPRLFWQEGPDGSRVLIGIKTEAKIKSKPFGIDPQIALDLWDIKTLSAF